MDLLERLRALARGTRDHLVLPFAPATKSMKITWIDPAENVWEDFSELDEVSEQLPAYLPLATVELGKDVLRILLVQRAAPHAVSLFFDGFRSLAPSLDAFEQGLLESGEEPPAAALESVCTAAGVRIDAGDDAVAVAMLTPVLARYPRTPDAYVHRGLKEQLAVAWTDLGVAHHQLGDDVAAAEAYAVAVTWGSKAARGNLLTLAIDKQRWSEARRHLAELLSAYTPAKEMNALRIKLVRVLAELGEREAAAALATQHVGYLSELLGLDRALALALQAQFVTELATLSSTGASAEIIEAVRAQLAAPLLDVAR